MECYYLQVSGSCRTFLYSLSSNFVQKRHTGQKQDGGQELGPWSGQMSTFPGKRVQWLSSFGHDGPGLLSSGCKFHGDTLNP